MRGMKSVSRAPVPHLQFITQTSSVEQVLGIINLSHRNQNGFKAGTKQRDINGAWDGETELVIEFCRAFDLLSENEFALAGPNLPTVRQSHGAVARKNFFDVSEFKLKAE